ncbi:MAG: translation elongation factor Ts [Rhodospirillales bacterium]
MSEITAALVKELRGKTGTGMMDCKKALGETGGDIEAAVDWLRSKGLAAAAKKAGRIAAEGLVGVAISGTNGAVVEVNSETDFVARNDAFQGFVAKVSELALATRGDEQKLKSVAYGDGRSVEEELTHMIATIGENMNLRRASVLSVETGIVASYVHNSLTAGLGKIGVIVALESTGDPVRLNEFGRQVAMHVAASAPMAVSRDQIDATVVDREREIFKEQARALGKPENIIEKMVEGRVRKFYEESCLLEQTFVIDGENSVGKAVENLSAAIGTPVAVAGFVRFLLGEGIEREEQDFAAEVAAVASA